MSDINKEELYRLHSKRDWKGIVNIFKKNNKVLFENKKLALIYVEAMRNIGEFESANTLELKMKKTLGKPMLMDIADMIFYGGLAQKKLVNGLADYLVESLDKKNTDLWQDFVKLILQGRNKELEESLDKRLSDCSKYVSPCRKIFITGFERSGTGALRDFLNEFSEVYEVPGSEIQTIAGKRGLSYLSLAENKEDLKGRFLEFFIVNALGLSRVFEYLDFKEVSRAQIIINSSDDKVLLGAFFYMYLDLFSENENVELVCQKFINRLLYALKKPEGKSVFLLNNVINARNIWMLNLVDNYVSFPVTRDPRSQYASKISTRMLGLTADNFIKTFLKTQRIYEAGLKSLDEKRGKVIEVKFEDIVLSEGKRSNIAKVCGLNNDLAQRFTRLKPDESVKNVYLYELDEFRSCKEEFSIINKSLGCFCVV